MLSYLLDLMKNAGCIVRDRFHIYCPGCGGTRAVEALLRLQPFRSLYYNPVVVLLIIVVICITGIRIAESKRARKYNTAKILVLKLFLAIWLAYSVVRNILLVSCGIDLLGDFS